VLAGVLLVAVGCSSGSDNEDDAPGSGIIQGTCDAFASRLKSCHLTLEGSGKAGCVDKLLSQCAIDCLDAAPCDEVGTYFCTAASPPSFTACLQNCDAPELECGDGSGTYLAGEACDGVSKCSNGADEAGCQFLCDDGDTVPNDYQCDGTIDCANGEDEVGCLLFDCTGFSDPPIPEDAHAGCEPFKAALDACGLVSEGTVFCSPTITPCLADCYAAATCDELADVGCNGTTNSALEACAAACPQAYSCDGVSGFPFEWVCDGVALCVDETDELASCPTFACPDDSVIPLQWRCDGAADCADGSDEEGCAMLICPE
jgi:hypothetical protein